MIYWLVILLTTVFLMHPVFLGVSFLGAFLLGIRQKGIKKVLWVYVCKTVPFFLLIACINPAFNHYGVTELFRLKTGPVTLEAIVYGLVLAFVLYISVLWFSSFHEIMTTDRFVYLFGKLSPDISLVLSFKDTNDERIEEAVDELQERRLQFRSLEILSICACLIY